MARIVPRARPWRTPTIAGLAGAGVGILGGLIGLEGAEFRLPILVAVFGYALRRAVGLKLFDWGPQVPWVSIEGCDCGGFFVRVALLDRLAALDDVDCGRLQARVAGLRASNRVAWVTTADDRPDGPLEVRAERPGNAG
jgi:hypothetical protein